MMPSAIPTKTALIPCLRYRDASTAIDWLCETFGFQRQLVVPGEGGTIAHAELSFGGGMIMLGSAVASDHGRLIAPSDELGSTGAQSIYVVLPDPDSTYEKAKAAGASIVIALKNEDFGSRSFACRDLEGHLWNFGTYDPWRNA